ncbi:SDR family NAD(P)-dependent oxidoreductase [Catenuloplanes sp. NPDC051500]|uniref:SDR family NAD(P)-dependent oxidoreductase n=1 Tax=Catenuloplanes sp. NPDC051500 TaxID=3363959 RepID=UPI003788EC61
MVEKREKVLTANSTVGDWLGHETGGPALRGLLGQGGFDESMLGPVKGVPLATLVELSDGRVPRAVVEGLVAAVNGGRIPEDDESAWVERIVPGRFEGRTVIVTGAASGIGRATASRILREGGRVVAVDLAEDRLDGLGGDVVPVAADITAQDGVDRIVAAAGTRIDGLANVAGIPDDFAPAHLVTDAVWDRVFAVNVDGLFKLVRAVLPAMMDAGRGAIVNVASEASLRGNAAGLAYTAAKHAVVGLTRNTAFMYGPHGIRVNAVAPGGVATGMAAGTSDFGRARLGPFLQLIPPVALAAHLAASITFLLSDDGINLNGVVLPSDGGWSVQ